MINVISRYSNVIRFYIKLFYKMRIIYKIKIFFIWTSTPRGIRTCSTPSGCFVNTPHTTFLNTFPKKFLLPRKSSFSLLFSSPFHYFFHFYFFIFFFIFFIIFLISFSTFLLHHCYYFLIIF
uniref:Uncharacterized protein n=1 Tax=Geladintestivirus 1 TaxID=3233133 RepID=A0AAU8MHJ9_9CAUD